MSPKVFYESGPGWISEGFGLIRAEGENRPSRPTHTILELIAFNGRQDPVSGPVTGALDTDRATQCIAHALIGHGKYALGVGTLRAKGGDCAGGSETLIAQCVTTGTGRRYDPESETLIVAGFKQGNSAQAGGIGYEIEKAPTLTAGQSGTNLVPAAVIPILEASARTRKSTTDPRAGIGIGKEGDPMYTLQASKQHAVAFTERGREGGRSLEWQDDLMYCLTSPGEGGRAQSRIITIGYAVRRLTPLECERLQGLPDGWTDIEGGSDTARYKAIGNGLAIPCPEWVIRRMANVLRGLPVDMEVPYEPQNAT